MSQIFTANYAIGDTVYYVIFATASIHACKVKNIFIKNNQVTYDLVRMDKDFSLPGIAESEVLSFANARLALINYLSLKLSQITALTA